MRTNQDIFAKVDLYISDLFAPETKGMQHAIHSLHEAGIANASVSPNQGKLLQILAMSCGAKRILEIGTLGAYSTLWLARSLPQDGIIISLEFDEKHAALAKKNIELAGYASTIDINLGKASDSLAKLIADHVEPFDMIFIDADKPPYVEYFESILKLSRPGTIIVADNVVRNGQVLDTHATDEKVQGVRRFNEYLASNKQVSATILQTVGVKEHDGLAIAIVNR